jgi:penicillin-binding protein 1A
LRIYTHLQVPKQLAASEAMAQGLEDVARRHGYTGAPGRIDADVYGQGLQALKKAFAPLAAQAGRGPNEPPLMWDLAPLGATPRAFGPSLARQLRAVPLLPYARTRALVVAVPSNNGPALIDLGGRQAQLPLKHMAWARPYSPQARTPRPKRPSDVVRVGDLVTVEVQPAGPGSALEVALVPEPKVEGALVAMAPPHGAVQALLGSRDAAAGTGFNRATQAKRQPGSAFKPILYAAGLAEHTITPASLCADSPVVITDPWTHELWKPENYEDGRYDGTILYRTALARSKNTCSVRLLQKVGLEATMATAQAMGIDAPLPNNLTLSLGTGEVTPLMMAQAMHTIANGGVWVAPTFIERVLDAHGQPLPLPAAPPDRQALAPDVAFVLTSMMRSVVESGTARKAQLLGRPLAAKTGTSQLSRDAWLVGFGPTLAATVWMGLDDDTSMGQETGASAALPAWVRFMGLALAAEPVMDFVMPPEVRPARIDPATGAASDASDAVVEVFVAGTEPLQDNQPLPSIFLEDDDRP